MAAFQWTLKWSNNVKAWSNIQIWTKFGQTRGF